MSRHGQESPASVEDLGAGIALPACELREDRAIGQAVAAAYWLRRGAQLGGTLAPAVRAESERLSALAPGELDQVAADQRRRVREQRLELDRLSGVDADWVEHELADGDPRIARLVEDAGVRAGGAESAANRSGIRPKAQSAAATCIRDRALHGFVRRFPPVPQLRTPFEVAQLGRLDRSSLEATWAAAGLRLLAICVKGLERQVGSALLARLDNAASQEVVRVAESTRLPLQHAQVKAAGAALVYARHRCRNEAALVPFVGSVVGTASLRDVDAAVLQRVLNRYSRTEAERLRVRMGDTWRCIPSEHTGLFRLLILMTLAAMARARTLPMEWCEAADRLTREAELGFGRLEQAPPAEG